MREIKRNLGIQLTAIKQKTSERVTIPAAPVGATVTIEGATWRKVSDVAWRDDAAGVVTFGPFPDALWVAERGLDEAAHFLRLFDKNDQRLEPDRLAVAEWLRFHDARRAAT